MDNCFSVYFLSRFRKGDICSVTSILELWSFDANIINALTDEKVLKDINNRGPQR